MLCLVVESPRHGFALRSMTARDGEIGRVWFVAPPVVYRSLTHLTDAGLIEARRTEPGDRGPQRTVYAATRRGRALSRAWLQLPVDHVRDVRSELLLKLALLDRAGVDRAALVRAQREVFQPIRRAVTGVDGDGLDRLLGRWRAENVAATLRFLDAVADDAVPTAVGTR